jgi:Ca2+-binding RTX toxin-like protein
LANLLLLAGLILNVLNYFNDLDTNLNINTNGLIFEPRGANTAIELTRQLDKIVQAIITSGADVLGLMELENNGYGANSAIQSLITGLNGVAGAGTYSFINPNTRLGTDAINDTLIGGLGVDSLVGGAGDDVFRFAGNAVFTATGQGRDTIQDFGTGNDQISLSKSVFASLTSVVGQGFSVGREFAVVQNDTLAFTSNALIVYNSSNGSLYYNQNGTAAGFGTGGAFASLTTTPTLTASNFSLI